VKHLSTPNKIELGERNQVRSSAVAVRENLTVGAGGVLVKGNVEGNIQILNKKMEVNADHGAVVNVYDTPPRVKRRDAIPQPKRKIRGFVNRSNELKRLEQIINSSEVATIHGMDGIGKSALLRQAANSTAARILPDGVLFMEGIDEHGQVLGIEDVIQRLFDKSYESEPHLKVNFDVAQTYLGTLKSLVVLNGLNLPITSLSRMPDLYPQSAMLIESYQSMDDDISDEINLGPLPRTEAIELLAAKADISPDDGLQPVLDSICALLADVPLAIVITARAIDENNLSFERAHDILASVKTLSTEAKRRGIERAYALAESTFTELERQWMAATALAPGISIDPHYLHQMAEDKSTAENAQKRLQAMGLLTANSPRLRIDPAVRDLARSGVDDLSFQERFVAYLKTMLKRNSFNWSYCTDELGNILGMISWAARKQRWNDVISLGRAIDPYLTLHGLWEAWRATSRDVLRAARRLGDRANEAWALHQLGTYAIGFGYSGQAIDFLRQALNLRLALGDVVGMAYTQHNLNLLIPPKASGGNNGRSPHKPNGGAPSPGKAFKYLLKTMIKTMLIGAVIVGGGILIVSALQQPFIPVTGEPISVMNTSTSSATRTATPTIMPTLTSTPTETVTNTLTPTETATNTATPTHTATNTATLTHTPTNSATPTDTPTLVLACSPSLTGLQAANCRVGPSTLFEVYGTLNQGQTVDILAINEEGTWFMVEHPQSYRKPCWVWDGPAVLAQGDLSCVQEISISPPTEVQLSPQKEPSFPSEVQSPSDGGGSTGTPIFIEPLSPIFIDPSLFTCLVPQEECPEKYKWIPETCSCQYVVQ